MKKNSFQDYLPFIFLAAIAILGIFIPAIPSFSDTSKYNYGDIAWILVASSLVFLMTRGLSFFYGAMVNRKNVISIMMQSFVATGLISVVWVVVGFSMAFGKSYHGLIGDQVYYVEATNAGGCASPTRTLVNVFANVAPDAPAVTGNQPGQCPGSTYTLTATSTVPGAVFKWYTTATGDTPVATGATFVTPQINADVTYYAEASTACVSASRTAASITVLKPLAKPVVDTAAVTTATSITFTWQPVPGATHYEVTLDNGVTFISPSSGANDTTHTVTGLQSNQSVTIKVRALSNQDCQTSALSNGVTAKARNPQGNNIFVPNLFSPNGDGVNDILYVYGTAIARLEFKVYNHWGQVVFHSKDQHHGWDGTMGGQKQPVGVYVWQLHAVMQDGTLIKRKGNVTLMR